MCVRVFMSKERVCVCVFVRREGGRWDGKYSYVFVLIHAQQLRHVFSLHLSDACARCHLWSIRLCVISHCIRTPLRVVSERGFVVKQVKPRGLHGIGEEAA